MMHLFPECPLHVWHWSGCGRSVALGAVLYSVSLFGSGEGIRLLSSGVYVRVTCLVTWGRGYENNSQTSGAHAINREAVMHPWLCSVVSASLEGCQSVEGECAGQRKAQSPLILSFPHRNLGHGMVSARVSSLLGFSLPRDCMSESTTEAEVSRSGWPVTQDSCFPTELAFTSFKACGGLEGSHLSTGLLSWLPSLLPGCTGPA